MKADGITVEVDAAKRPQHPAVARLAVQLYEHVFRAIDFGRLHGLEEQLCLQLADAVGMDRALELSRTLITELLEHAIGDPRRYFDTVPYGISRAERFAAAFEEDCQFCGVEAADGAGDPARSDAPGDDDDHGEACACCDMLVAEWRAKHAVALRRFGLAPAAAAPKLQPPVKPARPAIATWPTKLATGATKA